MLEAIALMCTAIDGDTLACGSERIRLQAIDAPEKPGTCRRGRVCAPGDYHASKAALARLIAGKRVNIVRNGTAAWGRTQANAYVDGRNLACRMIAGGWAVYQPRYDRGGIVRKECGL